MSAISDLYKDISTWVFNQQTSVGTILSTTFYTHLKGYTKDSGFSAVIKQYEAFAAKAILIPIENEQYRWIVSTCDTYLKDWRKKFSLSPIITGSGGTKTKAANYRHSMTSFAGPDIVATMTLPAVLGGVTKVIGELQTISYSIHREVSPVRTLGRINAKGFTAGARTIAGSLIFTVFNRNLVYEIQEEIIAKVAADKKKKSKSPFNRKGLIDRFKDITGNNYIVMDEMPPFDITITMQNEYGNKAFLVIKNIVIVDEGQVMSIEDMLVENTMSYMARDIQVLRSMKKT